MFIIVSFYSPIYVIFANWENKFYPARSGPESFIEFYIENFYLKNHCTAIPKS